MRVPPNLLDEIRARLPVSQIVGRRVPLKRAGREFKGLSPFKNEKTPSFTVNDEKGFYHCFATGEHGDVFTFLMQTEGISFPEAVERLADEWLEQKDVRRDEHDLITNGSRRALGVAAGAVRRGPRRPRCCRRERRGYVLAIDRGAELADVFGRGRGRWRAARTTSRRRAGRRRRRTRRAVHLG